MPRHSAETHLGLQDRASSGGLLHLRWLGGEGISHPLAHLLACLEVRYIFLGYLHFCTSLGIAAEPGRAVVQTETAEPSDLDALTGGEPQVAVLRQLLAWERDFAQDPATAGPGFEDRIYVFTPQSAVIELVAGATPVDFAYALHTDVGHRCRGAKVDGQLVPLSTPLANGQTVDVTVAKEGGPSLDWLNPELGFLRSPRARAKVRAWFNAQALAGTIARGRELVEKLLQREGRTALRLDDLAERLGFKDAEALFEVVGKDEYSLRHIEQLLRPAEPEPDEDEMPAFKRPRGLDGNSRGGVLVVGVESLLTNLARCCRPAPPDAIGGFVTRGKGVAVHRSDCQNFRHMDERLPERVIPVTWGEPPRGGEAAYPVDVLIEAGDRQGLLRDITEVFAKERMNVVGVHTQSVRDASGKTAWMTFTVEVADSGSFSAAGLSAGQSGCLVADDDRVGRRVGPPQQQRVGRVLRRHEEVDRLARAAHRAHVDLALVDVALENDLARGIHHARGRRRRRTGLRRHGGRDRGAAVGRVDVAEDVRDRRAVDADAGGLLDRQDGIDGDPVAALDDLQRERGRRASEQERRWDQQRRRELAGQLAHTGSP